MDYTTFNLNNICIFYGLNIIEFEKQFKSFFKHNKNDLNKWKIYIDEIDNNVIMISIGKSEVILFNDSLPYLELVKYNMLYKWLLELKNSYNENLSEEEKIKMFKLVYLFYKSMKSFEYSIDDKKQKKILDEQKQNPEYHIILMEKCFIDLRKVDCYEFLKNPFTTTINQKLEYETDKLLPGEYICKYDNNSGVFIAKSKTIDEAWDKYNNQKIISGDNIDISPQLPLADKILYTFSKKNFISEAIIVIKGKSLIEQKTN